MKPAVFPRYSNKVVVTDTCTFSTCSYGFPLTLFALLSELT